MYACMCDVSGVLKVWQLPLRCYVVYVSMSVYVCMSVCVYVWRIWRIEVMVVVGNGFKRVCVYVCMCSCVYACLCDVSGVWKVW